ncbi:MAG TPA: DUF4870 domain-containing protein [Armatimonadota bacterium]|jgi:hypothetical protein
MDQNVRIYAMLCHLLSLTLYLGLPLGNILGPLVIWLILRDRDPSINQHGKESLNFQITFMIYMLVLSAVGFVVGVLTCGLGFIPLGLLLGVLGIVQIVLVIQASVEAYNGRPYAYPMTIRFIL